MLEEAAQREYSEDEGEKENEDEESTLNEEQKDELQELFNEFRPLVETGKLGCVRGVQHSIQTGNALPVRQRYNCMNPRILEDVHKELDYRLENDIVEPSNSSWLSPLLVLRKKDKGYRWVVDFRRLNAVVESPDQYPLPRIDPILSQVGGATIISTIDIKDAYLQVTLAPGSREKTAFYVPGRGLFHFKRMPAGLKDAANFWQKTLERVFGTDREPHIIIYMDDILVWSPNNDWNHHVAMLRKVFQCLVEAGITLNLEKSRFGRKSVKYLGHVIDRYGNRPDPAKISAVMNFPRPTCVRHVRQFLGLAGWMRKYIPNFSIIAKPLHDLEKKNVKFRWDQEQRVAFLKLKEYLSKGPVLRSPDFTRRFSVYSDGSKAGLGAILTQMFEDGEHSVSYGSRSLRGREPNYAATELECLAALFAITHFREFLEGYKFTLFTDHSSLLWLHKLKNPSGRLARWAVQLQQYDFDIVHKKGTTMQAPDALSRNPIPADIRLVDVKNTSDEWYDALKLKIQDDPDNYPQFAIKDDRIMKLITVSSTEPFKWVQVVPKDSREEVLRNAHDSKTSGHFGFLRTFDKVRRAYYWPGMKDCVYIYVKSCDTCQKIKKERVRPPGLMGSSRIISAPFEVVSADLIGPLPRTAKGNTFLHVVVDCFSKYVILKPLRTATAAAVTRHIREEVFLRQGAPRVLLCDNGKQYDSHQFRGLCQEFKTKIFYNNIAYNPRSNPTERYNQTIETVICSYLQDEQDYHRKWDLYAPEVQCAMNSAISHVTGFSPHNGADLILDGREHTFDGNEDLVARDPEFSPAEEEHREEMLAEIRQRIRDAVARSRAHYNLRRRDEVLQPGCMVLRKNFVKSNKARGFSRKLGARFIGPFKIKAKVGKVSYSSVSLDEKEEGVWHIDQLKKYVGRQNRAVPSQFLASGGEM